MSLFHKLPALVIAGIITYVSPVHAAAHPTMILVHGALFTSSVWAPVQQYLQDNNYPVVTVDTPGRLHDGIAPQDATLSAAVEKVCLVVNQQPEPVILVGHNQAGAIITQAIASCGTQIKSLVYIAAVIPWPGERPFDLLSDQDNHHFDLSAPLDNATGLSNPDDKAPIQALFMADADETAAEQAIHNMVPEPIIFAYNKLDYDLLQFQHIPKYYIKTTQDLIIEPASQDKFIQRQAMQQIITLNSSHCPFISQPANIARILYEINNMETNK